jgi:hypothetical protein
MGEKCPTCGQEQVDWETEPLPSSDEVISAAMQEEWQDVPHIIYQYGHALAQHEKLLRNGMEADHEVMQHDRGLYFTKYAQLMDFLAVVNRTMLSDAATHGIVWPASLNLKHEAHTWQPEDDDPDAA